MSGMTFDFYPLRFRFHAQEAIHFPPGKAANTLRGAFGLVFRDITCVPECSDARSCPVRPTCAYAQLFEPGAALAVGPSGLAEHPRPFVFRSSHLDGRNILPGETFQMDVHLFTVSSSPIAQFVRTFTEIGHRGLGATRGKASLDDVFLLSTSDASEESACDSATGSIHSSLAARSILLDPGEVGVGRVRIEFLTPTELKGGASLTETPSFEVLISRIRDRISTLRSLYGNGPLEIDFQSFSRQARQVRVVTQEMQQIRTIRRSSRTGQSHRIGGFIGFADYEGELTEYLPYLRVARWTGVGRQTVWGKGEIRVSVRDSGG